MKISVGTVFVIMGSIFFGIGAVVMIVGIVMFFDVSADIVIYDTGSSLFALGDI